MDLCTLLYPKMMTHRTTVARCYMATWGGGGLGENDAHVCMADRSAVLKLSRHG